jgi:hypothetical protein
MAFTEITEEKDGCAYIFVREKPGETKSEYFVGIFLISKDFT